MAHKSLESLGAWIRSCYDEFNFDAEGRGPGTTEDFVDFLVSEKMDMLIPAKDFVAKYHPNIVYATLHYWMNNNFIDYITVGNNKERYVLLTKKTLNHQPTKHPARDEKEKKAS